MLLGDKECRRRALKVDDHHDAGNAMLASRERSRKRPARLTQLRGAARRTASFRCGRRSALSVAMALPDLYPMGPDRVTTFCSLELP